MGGWLKLTGIAMVVGSFLWGCATWFSGEVDPDLEPIETIPDRPSTAISGQAFIRQINHLGQVDRERAILAEFKKGNIPDFLRKLWPIYVTLRNSRGTYKAKIWVMADYLSIGNDHNYVRVPMNPLTAQAIADAYGCVLPTTKLVDEIYRQAKLKLSPKPMPPSPKMVSTNYFWRHHQTIQKQLGPQAINWIIAGHKKDVVLTNRLVKRPGRVAIYGWHRKNGRPIQGLSLVHHDKYADYSHGVRMIYGKMKINDVVYKTAEVMRDPRFSGLLSKEGVVKQVRIRTKYSSAANKPWRKSPALPLARQ